MAQDQQHGVVIGDDYANLVDDVKVLDMSEPITTSAGTSAFATASADFFMSGHNIEVGRASPSNSGAESCSEYFSTRIERMIQEKKEFATDLEFEVEASRVHWSELTPLNVEAANEVKLQGLKLESNGVEEGEIDDELGEAGGAGTTAETNMEIFRGFQKKYGPDFRINQEKESKIVVGRKIAEGGQAEIFEVILPSGRSKYCKTVLKVFKEGNSLRDLEKQWPLGMLQSKDFENHGVHNLVHTCLIFEALLLEDGRFAFRLERYWGDLRKLIDLKMQTNHNQGPPFTSYVTRRIMFDIARGMRGLHERNIVHRDLKAANVLINNIFLPDGPNPGLKKFDPMIYDDFYCRVADFECSVGVVGTRFWRAPEILRAVKSRNIKPELFTKSADVYSYGMTCYEIVTGRIPFEDVRANNYDVICGERPWIRDLIIWCWHPNPLKRPNFDTTVDIIKSTWCL